MKTVIALFDTFADADAAQTALIQNGITPDQVSAVTKHGPARTKAAAEGAGIGAAAGATVGFLASLGVLAIPGVGPLFAAGTIAATLIAAGTGAAAGGLIGGFIGLGIPAHEAEAYAEAIHRGHTLLSVIAPDADAPRIANLLAQNGALDLEEHADQWEAEGWKRKHPVPPTPSTPPTPDPEAIAKARDIEALESGNLDSSEPYPAHRGIDLGAVSNAGASIGSVGIGLAEGIGDIGRRRTARIY